MNESYLCTFLIPTRGRPAGLFKAIHSIFKSVPLGVAQVIVGVDNDDVDTMRNVPLLAAMQHVRVVIGPKPLFYDTVCELVTDLAALATGEWVSMVDDDVTLEGDWATPLRSMPKTGVFVTAEKYRLVDTTHLTMGRCEGWFVPNGCWRTVAYPVGGHARLRHPIDIQMKHILVDDNKWTQRVLPGVLYNHQHWMRK